MGLERRSATLEVKFKVDVGADAGKRAIGWMDKA